MAHIDPAGDTCFNRRQARTLLEELERRMSETGDPELAALSGALRVLVASAMHSPHRYLWFIGD